MTTDIIVTTHNRLEYLKRTLQYIYERTQSSYRLHVIDDASTEGNAEWLFGEFQAARVHHLYLRGEHIGAIGNQNAGAWLSFSDPVVFVDDDVLCPLVRPDWLGQGLKAMERHPQLALLALRHPGAKHKVYKKDGAVAFCESVGGTFLFCRREFLKLHPLPHKRGSLGWPMEPRCKLAKQYGWKAGVLINVFCYHIGEMSALTGEPYPGRFVPVVDSETLEPETRYW